MASRSDREEVCFPAVHSLHFGAMREENEMHLSCVSLLSTLHVSFLLLLFVEHTRTQTPGTVRPCSAVNIQKGLEWMAGICMH